MSQIKTTCFLTICILIGQLSNTVYSQINPCDIPSPFLKVERVELPKALKHKAITGYLPNGHLLVQSTKEVDPAPDKRATRQFWEVWLKKDGNIEHEKSLIDLPGEIAALDNTTIFYTSEIQGRRYFRLTDLDKKGRIDFDTDRPAPLDWDGEVLNPFIFRLSDESPKALVFAARKKGRQDYDLFISEIGTSIWTKPRPIENPQINTSFNERYPTVGSDGTLYFLSDRPGADCSGSGKVALEPWRVFPDFKKYWKESAAVPLPSPLASTSDERAVVSMRGSPSAGFFTSNREGGKYMELFSFKAEGEVPTEPNYYALVIGVSDYDELDYLPNPVPNASQMAQLLEQQRGFRVKLLENPTGTEILDNLTQYNHLQENDYLLVVFFGHGIALPNVKNPKTCLLAGKDGKPDGSNCVTPDAFQDRLLRSLQNPRHVLVILDACFGGLFKPQLVRGEFDNDSRKLLASTKGNWVPDKSCFFTFLKEKFGEGNAFNSQQLFSFIYDQMNGTSDTSPCKQNSPDYFDLPNSKHGDFPFPKALSQ